MRIPGGWRLRRVARRAAAWLDHRVMILVYHRVAEAATDPWRLCVTPRHFAEHLEVLRRRSQVLPLEKVVAGLEGGVLPRRAVVLTFDDGYADNLLNAKPLLETYGAPATVFVASGYIGQQREFWWDDLDRLFLQPGTLPERLRLRVNGGSYEWELGDAARYSESAFDRQRRWKAWESGDTRQRLYYSLWELMQPLAEGDRQKVCEELIAWSGCDPMPRPSHRPLRREEVALLARGGLVEIGCHTVTHPALSALAPDDQGREIRQSKIYLEEILGHRLTSFAYPYGRPCDYTPQTIALVQEAGFSCACSTTVAAVTRHTDRFQLPRVQVEDCDGEAFDNRLRAWFGD